MLKTELLFLSILGVAFVTGQFLIQADDDSKIVGGELVTNRSEFPFQVSVRNASRNSHFCGGIIIAKRVVLSAAHCFIRDTSPGAIMVVAGDLSLLGSNETSVHYNKAVINHENYNGSTYQEDISLVIIQDEFTWSIYVNYAPPARVVPSEGTNCTISGWGSIFSGGTLVYDLMYAHVLIISTYECSTNYGEDRITPGMVCAGSMEGGVDSCQGDSGGPLVCNGTAVGIVSWGRGCALAGYPGVYTDVAHYNAWIETKLSEFFETENQTTTASLPTTPSFTTESPTTLDPADGSSISYVGSLQLLVLVFVFNCVLA